MGFASSYLANRTLFTELINEAPDRLTGIIVVIPAYDEPGITEVLDSLSSCSEPDCKTEIVVLINAPDGASAERIANNEISLRNIEKWKRINDPFFRIYAIDAGSPNIPGWGVGLARKAAMDEAVRRFDAIDRPDGVIVNLDADCRVGRHYFRVLCDEFLNNPGRKACSVYFEHPVTGSDYPAENYTAVTLYELHLRYFYQGMLLTGFPYVFHTVGSAIAVKALPYISSGGMNRRQAGEDFYFIQKIAPSGGFYYLNSATVYPSPRISLRVPFGTGPVMAKMTSMEHPSFLTYDIKAFMELRSFFNLTGIFYETGKEKLEECLNLIPEGIKAFLEGKDFFNKVMEIKDNTAHFSTFKKRFFSWFNMFMVVKYLNYVHQSLFSKNDVVKAAWLLLEYSGKEICSDDPVSILEIYRSLERGSCQPYD